jgi:acetylglutamate kinase
VSASSISLDKAEILAEAVPWIRAHRNRTMVVKLGGEALEEPDSLRSVTSDLALLALVGVRLVIVHGGGPQVSRAMVGAGIEPSFVQGLRVTGDAAMEIVRQVLVGSINSDLVIKLCEVGLKAVGLTGADAGLLEADLASEELGRVGRVTRVDSGLVLSLLDDGYTPVIAPVGCGPDGKPLNLNADTVAGAVAGGVKAEKLVYLTNVEGLYRDLGGAGSLISELSVAELERMLPQLSDGMRPKAESAVDAMSAGVGKAHILDGRVAHSLLLEVFTDEGVGTQVRP